MKVKRFLSGLLVLAMLLGLCVNTAFAAGNDYVAGLTVTKVDDAKLSVSCKAGPSGSSTKIQAVQTFVVAFDTTVFKPLLRNGTGTFELTTEPVQKAMAFYEWENPVTCETWSTKVYPYRSADGKTGFLIIQPANGETATLTSVVTLASVYLGFQTGKDYSDVSAQTIRFATAEELAGLSIDKALKFNDGVNPAYVWSNGGTGDTLIFATPPAVEASGFSFFVQAQPTCVAPDGVTATYGQTLADIALNNPAGNTDGSWTWMQPETPVGNASMAAKTFKAKFTPSDGKTYFTMENIDVSVTVNAKNISDVTAAAIVNQVYTGNQITPDVTVTGDGGKTLVKDVDYTVTYGANVAIGNGSGSVTVKDKEGGNYTFNDLTATFNIVPKTASITINDPGTITYDGAAVTAGAAGLGADIIYTYTGDGTVIVKWYDDNAGEKGAGRTAAPVDAGNYWVGVSATAGTEYGAVAEVSKKFTISRKALTAGDFTKGANPTYTGSQIDVPISSSALTSADYTVGGTKSLIDVQASDVTATVTGQGNYTGTVNFTWNLEKAILTLPNAYADSKAYDGTTAADIKPGALSGVLASDDVSVAETSVAGSFNNQYVGTGKTVTTTNRFNLAGAKAGNYTLTQPSGITGNITAVQDPANINAAANVIKTGTVELSSNVSGAQGNVSYAITTALPGCSVDANGKFTAGNTTGSCIVTVTVAAKDLNNDNIDEYTGKNGTITVTVSDKTSATLTVSQNGCTYGQTLADPIYTAPANSGAPIITYHGTGRNGASYGPTATKPSEAGKYTVTVECETLTHIYTGTSPEFTIAPKDISGANVELGTALTYTGASQSQSVTKVELDGTIIPTADYNVTSNTGINAGNYSLTVAAKNTGNYSGSLTRAFTIAGKPITPAIDVSGTYTYNGNAQLPTFTVKDSSTGTELVPGDYTATISNNINAGAGKITVNAKAGGNYDFAEKTANFTIGKAAARTLADISVSQKFSVTTEQSKDIGRAGMPDAAGALTYTPGTAISSGSAVVSAWNVDADGRVSYTITGGAIGDTVTLPVKISSVNYEDSSVNVLITITDKDAQAPLSYSGATTVTYGSTLNLSVSGGSGSGAVTYAVTAGSGNADVSGNVLKPTLAGTVSIIATKAADLDYAEAKSVSVIITINKARPTGTPAYTAITTSGMTLADTALTIGSITPTGGTIVWDAGDTQAVVANTAYAWTYTPASSDYVNYDKLTGTITPYVVYIADDEPASPATIPANDGNVSVDYTESNGSVSLDMPDRKVEEIIGQSSGGKVDIDVSGVKNATAAEMPKGALTAFAEADLALKVKLPTGSIALDKEALNSIAGQTEGEKVSMELLPVKTESLSDTQKESVKTDDIVVDINISAGEQKISSFNGELEIQIPYSGSLPVAVWYLNDAGELERVNCRFENGVLTFYLDHLSLYLLGQDKGREEKWENPFTDVKEKDWFYSATRFAYVNKLMNGISGNLFDSHGSMTRGMIVTMLHRLEGTPEPAVSNPFDDVAEGKYYTKAVIWAAENKIVSGYGSGIFGPEDDITREQMALILMNFAKYKGYDISARGELNKFTDADEVSGWAKDAMSWANAEALITGDGAHLRPIEKAERCQVAELFRRFIGNMQQK